MKILIVRTFPSIINPNQYNVQEIGLAKALTRAGHDCGIVLYHGKNKDSIEKIPVLCGEEEREILVYRMHGFNILKNGFFPSLNRITKEYDVIQVHEYDQITSWFYYAWSKRPVVVYHGPYFHSFNKGYNTKCNIFDHVFLKLRHNKNVVCLTKSHAAERFLKDKGFKDVTAVGVGVDTDNFKRRNQETESPIEVPADKFNLLYVGKLEERRNSFFLLEVMEDICKRQDGINCIVIGDGDAEYKNQFLKKADGLIKCGKLQYYTSASQSQLAEVYQKTQLMLFPSHYEIFGMVLLEAVHFGLPVISTPNGGSDMLIRDKENGWILKEDSVTAWSDLVEEIYTDTEMYEKVRSNLIEDAGQSIYWDEKVKDFSNGYDKAYRRKN